MKTELQKHEQGYFGKFQCVNIKKSRQQALPYGDFDRL